MNVIPASQNLTSEGRPHQTLQWLISFKNPLDLWTDNWVALVYEVTLIFLFIRTWKHARSRGIRAACFLLSCFLSGLGMELIQAFPNPGYQLWWYHQGMINFLNGRVPSFIPLGVACLYYYVDYGNRKMNLPVIAQSFVNAVTCSFLAFPFQALAPNLQIVLLHLNDPMVAERIFHTSFLQLTATFLFFFHMGHYFNTNFDYVARKDKKLSKHAFDCIGTGFYSGVYTITEAYLLYLTVKLLLQQHTVLCLIFAIFILAFLVHNELKNGLNSLNFVGLSETLFTKRFLYFGILLLLASSMPLMLRPENLKSDGERLELGPCDAFLNVTNSSPIPVPRRKYICTEDGPESGFDFHCVDSKSYILPTKRYTLCGIPFDDRLFDNLILYSIGAFGMLLLLCSWKNNQRINAETQNGSSVAH